MSPSSPRPLIIDGHVDVRPAGDDYDFPLESAIEGGVHAAVVPVRASRIPRRAAAGTGVDELEKTYAAITRTAAGSGGRAAIATSPEAVVSNAAQGVFSFVLGFQNARPLPDLAAVEAWLDRGIAVFDFGFIGDNQWARSSRPYPSAGVDVDDDGISALGLAAVELLNDRGVVIDTAQVSERARHRIVEASTAPVIASHNGVKARVPGADRAIGDEEIARIADTGGIVQIVAFDGYHRFRGDDPRIVEDIRELRERYGLPGHRGPADYYALLDPETAEWDEETFQDYFREYHAKVRHGWPKTDVSTLVRSVRHVADLVGVDHVGLASDFHHGGGVRGWLDFGDTPNLTAELRKHFSDDEVARIWGGNLLRVWERAQAASAR